MGIVHQDRGFWQWSSTLFLLIVLVLGAVQAGAGQLGCAVQDDNSHESRMHEEEPGTTDGNQSSGKRQIFHEEKPKEEKVDDTRVQEVRRVLQNSPNNSYTSDSKVAPTPPSPPRSSEPPTPPSPPRSSEPPTPPSSQPPKRPGPAPKSQPSQSVQNFTQPDQGPATRSGSPNGPSLIFDSSCTAPDLDAPISEDCTIREGNKVVDYLNTIRAQNGLPPFKTSIQLQSAVRLQLLTLVGCDVCNQEVAQCIGNCNSSQPACRGECEAEYEQCKQTECSPLFFLDCCSCSAPAESFAGRHLQDDPKKYCSRVDSHLSSNNAGQTAKDINSKNKAPADKNYNCVACGTAKQEKVGGYDFVTLCKFCRKCPGAKRPTKS